MKKTTMLSLTTLALTAVFSLTACGNTAASNAPAASTVSAGSAAPQAAAAVTPAGTVLLSVNPEIEMEYDDAGQVLALNALNGDGSAVLEGYTGYEGKPCTGVVSELVSRINQDGYFEKTIAGQEKNIVLRLEHGSSVPDEQFMNDLANAARTTVEAEQIGSRTVALDQDDLDDTHPGKDYINAQAAESLLAAQLGRDDLQFVEREYDLDDGDYEVAFVLDGVEYEYEVDAVTGKVTEMDVDGVDHDDDLYDDDVYDDDVYDDLYDDDVYDDHDDLYDDDVYDDDVYDDLYDDDLYDDDIYDDLYDDDVYDDDIYDDYDDIYDDDIYDDYDDDRDDDFDDDDDDDHDDDDDDDWDD